MKDNTVDNKTLHPIIHLCNNSMDILKLFAEGETLNKKDTTWSDNMVPHDNNKVKHTS